MERLRFLSSFRKFCGAEDGAIGVILAVSAPVVLGFAGLAVDYSMWKKEQTALTRMSESAAMAAAYAMDRGAEDESVLEQYARADAIRNGFDPATQTLDITVDGRNITVDIQKETKRFLSSVINNDPFIINSRGEAELVDPNENDIISPPETFTYPCIVAELRHPETNRGIYLHNDAVIDADGCGIQSNSTDVNPDRWVEEASIYMRNASVKADYIRSVGETVVNDWNGLTTTSVEPQSNSAHFGDVFIAVQLLSFGPVTNFALCDHNRDTIVNWAPTPTVLKPGTYCGDIIIQNGAQVRFEPGQYTIHNGDFRVRGGAKVLDSTDVTFYFSGFDAGIWAINNDADVQLSAPSTGLSAGILIWQNYLADCSNDPQHEQNTFSGGARLKLDGIIYAPSCGVILDNNAELMPSATDKHLSIHAGWFEMKGRSKITLHGAQADPFIADSTGYSKSVLDPDAEFVQNDPDFVPTLRFSE